MNRLRYINNRIRMDSQIDKLFSITNEWNLWALAKSITMLGFSYMIILLTPGKISYLIQNYISW